MPTLDKCLDLAGQPLHELLRSSGLQLWYRGKQCSLFKTNCQYDRHGDSLIVRDDKWDTPVNRTIGSYHSRVDVSDRRHEIYGHGTRLKLQS